MNKHFNLVSNLTVVKKSVTLGAGIMITLFSCVDNSYAAGTFVRGDVHEEVVLDCLPSICANVEISLAPNIELAETDNSSQATIEGGDVDILGNFVSSILRNTKTLDSDFSKVVDENFWDLI